MLIPPHLRYWIRGARSLELCNVGTSGFLAFQVAADRCRTTKQTAVVKGTCSIFKAINWIDGKKKTSNSLEQCVAGRASAGKTCAWSCGEWLSKSENGELMWRLPLSESWFSWLMDFKHPQLHSSVPANYQLLSRFAASKNLHLPELRSFWENSPFPISEKILQKKHLLQWGWVRSFWNPLPKYLNSSMGFKTQHLPSTYHHLKMQLFLCVQCFVGPLSLISQIHPRKMEPIVQPFSHPLYSSWIHLPVQLA